MDIKLIFSVIFLIIGLILVGIYIKNNKYNSTLYNKELMTGIIIILLTSVILLILHFVIRGKGCKYVPKDKSPVQIGVALAPSVISPKINKIKLSEILNDIDMFWDWLPSYSENLYDVNKNTQTDEKYIPMLWSSSSSDKGDKPTNPTLVQKAIEYIKTANYMTKTVFSWNEPDMLGTMMLPSNKATSAGFWTDKPFVYGNAIKGGLTSIPKSFQNTTYKNLANILKKEGSEIKNVSKDIKLATPVMSMSADIGRGCSGFEPLSPNQDGVCGSSGSDVDFPVKIAQTCGYPSDTTAPCVSSCKYTSLEQCNGIPLYKDNNSNSECKNGCYLDVNGKKSSKCICNGWLSLVKNVDSSWLEKYDIINIHCYSKFAHLVKLHILEYFIVFYDDIIKRTYDKHKTNVTKNGKELWLTEVACIYNSSDINSKTPVELESEFIKNLLWEDTDISSLPSECNDLVSTYDRYNLPNILPGLRTNKKFIFKGNSGSWYDHGLGGISWFTAKDFPGFDVGCGNHANLINSNIWTNDKLNDIYYALIGNYC
jgi:hypothetical protein